MTAPGAYRSFRLGVELELQLQAYVTATWELQIRVVLFSFFFFSFLAALHHMEFLGQGSDLSCSCDLCRSGNAKSLTHRARLGIKPVSQCSGDVTDPTEPQ